MSVIGPYAAEQGSSNETLKNHLCTNVIDKLDPDNLKINVAFEDSQAGMSGYNEHNKVGLLCYCHIHRKGK